MNIVFDCQIFYLQRYGGISRYFYELANELDQIKECNPKIVAPFHSNEYLEKESKKNFIFTFNPFLKKLFNNRLYNRQLAVNEFFARKLSSGKKNTVFHETYYTKRLQVDAPKVITIHDMIYEMFHNNSEEERELIQKKKQAIMEADSIIAVSENTRKDLLNFYPGVKEKTFVVYHGVDQSSHPGINKYNRPKPFLLHVGNRGWYKNFDTLLEIFGDKKNMNTTADLICFGGGKATAQEEALIKKYNLRDKVFFISGTDELLISLYKSATALVYMSNYEGFGMPVLEAMALSCPVVCSNTSSLPEVYGNAALAIDPKNTRELINGLNSIIFDNALRSKFINAGLERVQHFTWKKCAQETLDIYKKLI